MADYRAIGAVSEAVRQLMFQNYRFEDFNNELEFKVYVAKDFSQPMTAGVSVFLYRIFSNGLQRVQVMRPTPEGQPQKTQLPLDLHFLLTAWAQDASLQHTIAGWMMRTVEDTPTLPISLLNQLHLGLFRNDETVTLMPAELTTEELFRMWEVVVSHADQISVPYVVRGVKIESNLALTVGGKLVQERILDMEQGKEPPA
jgi:hypothetical protein